MLNVITINGVIQSYINGSTSGHYNELCIFSNETLIWLPNVTVTDNVNRFIYNKAAGKFYFIQIGKRMFCFGVVAGPNFVNDALAIAEHKSASIKMYLALILSCICAVIIMPTILSVWCAAPIAIWSYLHLNTWRQAPDVDALSAGMSCY